MQLRARVQQREREIREHISKLHHAELPMVCRHDHPRVQRDCKRCCAATSSFHSNRASPHPARVDVRHNMFCGSAAARQPPKKTCNTCRARLRYSCLCCDRDAHCSPRYPCNSPLLFPTQDWEAELFEAALALPAEQWSCHVQDVPLITSMGPMPMSADPAPTLAHARTVDGGYKEGVSSPSYHWLSTNSFLGGDFPTSVSRTALKCAGSDAVPGQAGVRLYIREHRSCSGNAAVTFALKGNFPEHVGTIRLVLNCAGSKNVAFMAGSRDMHREVSQEDNNEVPALSTKGSTS